MTSVSQPPLSFATTLTVSELSLSLRKHVENHFGRVRLRGEISNFKIHSSGHSYFSLKDDASVIDAVCWRGVASRLPHTLSDGIDVICEGRITTYPARSKYQIVVEGVELAGEGALLKIFQDRKNRLAAEGLFDSTRKKPLPNFPKKIGLITSETGAVLHDILHRLKDRYPCHVILWPVAVQGATASHEIATAVAGFNALLNDERPDVLILARGGGSLEDLWSFNEELVVRSVAGSLIPIISAVGHETDVTLVDFAADCRAPTPTAAAEMATPVLLDWLEKVRGTNNRMVISIDRYFHLLKTVFEKTVLRLISPQRSLELKTQMLDDRLERMMLTIKQKLYQERLSLSFVSNKIRPLGDNLVLKQRLRLDSLAQLLESYSYTKTLRRGFVLAQSPSGKLITSSHEARQQKEIILDFFDGHVSVRL